MVLVTPAIARLSLAHVLGFTVPVPSPETLVVQSWVGFRPNPELVALNGFAKMLNGFLLRSEPRLKPIDQFKFTDSVQKDIFTKDAL